MRHRRLISRAEAAHLDLSSRVSALSRTERKARQEQQKIPAIAAPPSKTSPACRYFSLTLPA